MGTCPNCGKNKTFLKKVTCNICGKIGCPECFSFLFRLLKNDNLKETWYACSENCLDRIAGKIESQIDPKEIKPGTNQIPISSFVDRVVLAHVPNKKGYYISFFEVFTVGPAIPASVLWKRLVKYSHLIQADHYVTLGEYENAANIYKSYGMYERAGEVRAKRNEAYALTRKETDAAEKTNVREIIKEKEVIVKVRCPYCLKLYDESENQCPNCSAPR